MNNIRIGVIGIVTNGEHPEMRIQIEDDSPNTRGYVIYLWWRGSNGPNFHNAFDDWVATKDDLGEYMEETGWVIEWQEDGSL